MSFDRWQKRVISPNCQEQMKQYDGNLDNIHNSTRFVEEDGSFLRLKSVTLAYNFPQRLLSDIKVQNLSIYATAQNLLTFTKYSGFDPEVNAYGE